MKFVSPMGQLRPFFVDKNGKRLAGGEVYTYEAGTLTPKNTFRDGAGTIPNTNPIILDGSGEADIYLSGFYRFRVLDRQGNLIFDVDDFKALDEINLAVFDDAVQQTQELRNNAAELVSEAEALLSNTTEQANAAEDAATNATTQVNGLKGYVDSALTGLSLANKTYATVAAANADIANIAVNQSVWVSSATEGGLYEKSTAGATSLTKSAFDPVTQAKNYADANGLFKPVKITSGTEVSANLYTTSGWYIVTSDTMATNMGLPSPNAGFFLVVSNGSGMVTQKWLPYNSNKEYIRTSNVLTAFPAWQEVITQTLLTNQLASYPTKTELNTTLTGYLTPSNISPYLLKPYDIVAPSKNLYDASKKQAGKYLNSSGNIASTSGWACSDFIPVIAGQWYTISFTTKRNGLAWFADKETSSTTNLGYNSALTNPLTVQAPAGANYLVVNIDSTTITGVNVQVEAGQVATTYEPFGDKYQIDTSYLSEPSTSVGDLSVNGASATLSGYIDNKKISLDLLLTRDSTHSQSTVFNFFKDTIDNVVQRNLTDDVAPFRMDGTTIGANHGYQKSNVTLAAHGKTVADIGSVWSSGGKQYVIVDIVSNDALSITSRADNAAFILAELTHVSGAANTASFTPTATVSAQWYPAIRDRKLTCFVDDLNIDLSKSGTYNFKNTVKFLESYSIMKKSDMVEWLIANSGMNHENYDAVPAYTVNFGYTFDHECGCTVYFGGVGRKTVDLIDQMITQSIQLAQGNGTVYNYIPKAVEFTAGGFTYNFAQLENLYSKNPSSALFLTAARQESGVNPIDRIIMLNDQVGYATGYLPVLDAAPDVRVTNASNKYLEIRNSSLKLYPRLIDSASITQINEGDAFAAIAYRKYFKRSADRTCNYVVRSEMGDYLYLDWHAAKTDEIELPADLVGREFEIVEKSSNVTLLSKFASNSILVKIDSTKNYGYLVLRFK